MQPLLCGSCVPQWSRSLGSLVMNPDKWTTELSIGQHVLFLLNTWCSSAFYLTSLREYHEQPTSIVCNKFCNFQFWYGADRFDACPGTQAYNSVCAAWSLPFCIDQWDLQRCTSKLRGMRALRTCCVSGAAPYNYPFSGSSSQ